MPKQLSLLPFHLKRPLKVKWRSSYVSGDVLDSFRSKSLRKFLRKADDGLAKHNITVESRVLSKQDFLDWLPYYAQKMQERGFSVLATEEFYDTRTADGKSIEGIFFTQINEGDSRLVGSEIFTLKGVEIGTSAFKASDQLDLFSEANSSIGAILDYFFIREMAKRGVKNISGGKSTNAFGAINTMSYPSYKMRFSYVPSPAENEPLVDTVPLNEDGVVTFYAIDEKNQLAAYGAHPAGTTITFELAQYSTPELPFHDIEYTSDQLIDVTE